MQENFRIKVIEPPIYEKLNWDMNLVMRALEYLRRVLPNYLKELPESTEYILVVYGDLLGNAFPAIGVGCKKTEEFDKIPTFLKLYDKVEKIIEEELDIEKIKKDIKHIKVISWEELQQIEYYPNKLYSSE